MVTTYLSAGSNLGNRETHLRHGIRMLEEAGVLPARISSLYETEPVGYLDQPWFLNLVIEARTALEPVNLLAACRSAEAAEGRVATFRNGPRPLDLDILLYGSVVLQTPELVIPHPRLSRRRFVLEPLAEVAPELVHPVLRKSVRSLLEHCPDKSRVRLYLPGDHP